MSSSDRTSRSSPSSFRSSARRWAPLATLATTLLATAAGAQSTTVPRFELERLEFNPDGQGSLFVGTGEMLKERSFRLTVFAHYQNDPLVLRQGGENPLVRDRWTTNILAAWAPESWFELYAHLPVTVWQGGSAGNLPFAAPRSAGFGSPQVGVRASALNQDRDSTPVDLSFELALGLPFGEDGIVGRDVGPRVVPKVMVGRRFEAVQVGFEAGMLFRPGFAFPEGTIPDRLGHQVRLGAVVSGRGDGVRPEFAVRADLPLADEPASLQLLAGIRAPLARGVDVVGGFGPAFGDGVGTPNFRALLGLSFGTAGDVCMAGGTHTPEECPNLDDDGDGVKNRDDACPGQGGKVDARGCPVQDQDADGVADAEDRCPDKAGVAALQGCPDQDGDGVADAEDRCPDKAGVLAFKGCPDTDADGIQDSEDRCPDKAGVAEFKGCPDTDSDGIQDSADRCPTEAGLKELRGCPAKDTDADTVADHLDNCPTEKGDPANRGCPAAQKQLVAITQGKLEISDKIYFDLGKATLQARSNRLLDQISNVIQQHPEIEKVIIEGHTDNVGEPARNQELSKQRADAVQAYLVQKGVKAERLETQGFGQERPLATNDTEEGRAANRRVDFLIPDASK